MTVRTGPLPTQSTYSKVDLNIKRVMIVKVKIVDLLHNLLTTKGRINRTEFLAYNFLYMLVFYTVLVSLSYVPEIIQSILGIMMLLSWLILAFMLTIRRVHDYDEGVWYALLSLVPIVNLYVWFTPGIPISNRYGRPPPTPSISVKILAALYIASPFITLGIFVLILQNQ